MVKLGDDPTDLLENILEKDRIRIYRLGLDKLSSVKFSLLSLGFLVLLAIFDGFFFGLSSP